MHEWEEEMIKKGINEEKALVEMNKRIKDYNEYIEKQTKKHNERIFYTFVCTAAPLAISAARAITGQFDFDVFSAASLVPGVASIVGFIKINIKPEIDNRDEPAAVFHDANRAIRGFQGWLSRSRL